MRAALCLALALAAGPAAAQQQPAFPAFEGKIEPVSGFTGQMSMTMPGETPEDMAVEEVIRFEPWQMLDDMFRDDIVLLMRSGPSDWSVPDAPDAANVECDAQRLLSEEGQEGMRQFGMLLVVNGLAPGEILVSERCRAQQTYLALETGLLAADMNAMDGISVDTRAELGPLFAGGEVEALREDILTWDGGDGDGPLLIVTHFDAIEALTRFRTYEGEILIVDPAREGRVLGYLRLASAVPDALRFPEDVVDYARRTRAAAGD